MMIERHWRIALVTVVCAGLSQPVVSLAESQNTTKAQDQKPITPPTEGSAPKTPPARKWAPKKKRKPVSSPDCQLSTEPGARSVRNGGESASKDCPPVKVVVRNGGTSEPAIHLSGAGNDEQDTHRRQNTEQLLNSTGHNLQQLASRQLAPAEKDMVDQILHYSEQSRTATAAGDLELGHNFALKAHLLSDELLNH